MSNTVSLQCPECGEIISGSKGQGVCAAIREHNASHAQPEDPRAHEAIKIYIRDTARRCAEICETEEVLLSVDDWETRRKVSAATAVALGALIRREFGLEAK